MSEFILTFSLIHIWWLNALFWVKVAASELKLAFPAFLQNMHIIYNYKIFLRSFLLCFLCDRIRNVKNWRNTNTFWKAKWNGGRGGQMLTMNHTVMRISNLFYKFWHSPILAKQCMNFIGISYLFQKRTDIEEAHHANFFCTFYYDN